MNWGMQESESTQAGASALTTKRDATARDQKVRLRVKGAGSQHKPSRQIIETIISVAYCVNRRWDCESTWNNGSDSILMKSRRRLRWSRWENQRYAQSGAIFPRPARARCGERRGGSGGCAVVCSVPPQGAPVSEVWDDFSASAQPVFPTTGGSADVGSDSPIRCPRTALPL